MTPKQFKELREGDVIRNKDGHGYFVLSNDSYSTLVQRTISIHDPESWELTGRLGPPAPTPPTQEEKMKVLIDAGWTCRDCFGRAKWVSPKGRPFSSFEYAYSAQTTVVEPKG